MNKPIHVMDVEFEEKVLRSELPVIVDFWAPWCGPCKMIAPILDGIAKSNEDKLIVAKVNTDENTEWADYYGIQGIPTMLFISHGEVIDRLVGAAPPPVMHDMAQALLNASQVVQA